MIALEFNALSTKKESRRLPLKTLLALSLTRRPRNPDGLVNGTTKSKP
jgi:hypothetical protein